MGNDLLIPLGDNSLYWFFLFWGSGEKGDFFESRKSKIETARNRSCRKSKYIDSGFYFLDFLFVNDSKFVFLINNQKTESLVLYIIGKYSMSSNNDINITIFQSFSCLCDLFFTIHACHDGNTHSKLGKSLTKCFIVFVCKDEKW